MTYVYLLSCKNVYPNFYEGFFIRRSTNDTFISASGEPFLLKLLLVAALYMLHTYMDTVCIYVWYIF